MGFFDSVAKPFATLGFVLAGAAIAGPFGAIAGGLLGAALLGQQAPKTPSAAGRSERRLAAVADPNMPYVYNYGRPVVGYSRAWTGVDEDHRHRFKGIDGIIGDGHHDIASLSEWGVQLNDDYFPVLTSDPGSGEGLMLNSGNAIADDLPIDWLVPIRSSKYWRKDQSQSSPDEKIWHFAIKIFTNHAQANDPKMAAIFGTAYTNRARWYTGKTGFHALTRANTDLATPPAGQFNLVFLIRGLDDVFDWRTGNTGWTANAALVFADQVKKRFGVGNSAFTTSNMTVAADACDDTSWDARLPGERKYQVNDQFRDEEPDIEVLQRIAAHFGGFFSERGNKIILAPGRAQGSVMALTEADFAGEDHILTPPEEADWFNTVAASYTPRWNAEGALHGKMVPLKSFTKTAYQTEDGGVEIPVERAYEVPAGRHAKYLALRELKQRRLAVGSGGAASYAGTFKMRAVALEIGDVITIKNAALWDGAIQWQVIEKALNFDDWTVRLGCIRYDADVEDPEGIPDDEPLGVRDKRFGGLLKPLAGLTASVVQGSGVVTATGAMRCSVTVSWSDPNNTAVDMGSIIVAWKLAVGEAWPGKSRKVAGLSAYMILTDIPVGRAVQIRAAVESPFRQLSEWSDWVNLTVTDVGPNIYGPEGTPLTQHSSGNLLSDPYFLWDYDSAVGDGIKLGTHVLSTTAGGVVVASGWDGGVTWDAGILWAAEGVGDIGRVRTVSDYGYWSVTRNGVTTKTSVRLSLTGATGDSQSFNVLEFIPVSPGQIYQVGCSLVFGSVGQLRAQMLLYDANRTFIANSTSIVVDQVASGKVAGQWYHKSAPFQVQPVGSVLPSFARLQFKQIKSGSPGIEEVVNLDGLVLIKINQASRPYDPDEEEVVDGTAIGSNYQILANFGLPKTPQGGGFHASGDAEFRFEFSCDAQVAVASTTSIAAKTWAEFRLVLSDGTHPRWAPSTAYVIGDRVRNRAPTSSTERTYRCDISGTSAGSGDGPLGETSGIVDGTARWDFREITPEIVISKTPNKQYARLTTSAGDTTATRDPTSWTPVRMHPTYTPPAGIWLVRAHARLTPTANGGDPSHTRINVRDMSLYYEILENEVSAAEG